MPVHIEIDRDRPLGEQPHRGHNRWHPGIPAMAHVEPGVAVVVEALDALDGQISNSTTPESMSAIERRVGHALTGPIHIAGAQPGDLLRIEVDDVETQSFGFTANFNDFGFLRDQFPKPFLARWDIDEGYATSVDIPGVKIRGAPFMGVIGVAPSHDLFERVTRREAEHASHGGSVLLPTRVAAVPQVEPMASTGLRTAPPRENGGNVDIRQVTAGSTVYLPVFQEGALFSIGDGHFAQGDGEVCGTAIETGTTVSLRFQVIEGAGRGRSGLTFEGPTQTQPSESGPFYATTGVCINADGRNRSEDVTLAARNALEDMLDYIVETHGLTREQAYLLCSVAVDLRISQVVDLPNVLVSAFLPLDVFTS